MELTPAQAKQLRMTLAFRENPPTVAWYFRMNWKVYTYLGTLCVGAILFFAWNGLPIISGFFGGILFTAITRDLKLFARFVQGWPLSNEIMDWQRVEELLVSADKIHSDTSPEPMHEK